MIYLSSITEIIWSNFRQYIQQEVILFQISSKQANFAQSMGKWKPIKHSVLCEKDFQADGYVCGTKNLANLYDPKTSKDLIPTKKYLKPVAVPSIFDFPAHLKKEKTPKRPLAKRHILDSPQSACSEKKTLR